MLILYLKIKCGVNQIWCYQNYLVIPTTRRFPDAYSQILVKQRKWCYNKHSQTDSHYSSLKIIRDRLESSM
jgi:hypothetical protein